MTYSVVAMDPEEELVGVAVASRFIAVGAVVPWVRHGAGAIATQSYANYSFGPEGLDLLSDHSAKETLKILLDKDPQREKRQVGIIDRMGKVASFTGKECFNYADSIEGKNFTVQGNILTGRNVLESMASEMETDQPFIERMIRALKAGESAGGDSRGKQAAAILIAGCIGFTEPPWPLSQTLVKAAIASATEDPRFRPISSRELSGLEYEVTILTEPVEIHPNTGADMQKIQIGKHGLMIEAYGMRGLLLPQVAVEEGLNASEFLDATCEKAGLPPGCWKSMNAKVFLFEGIVYNEIKRE